MTIACRAMTAFIALWLGAVACHAATTIPQNSPLLKKKCGGDIEYCFWCTPNHCYFVGKCDGTHCTLTIDIKQGGKPIRGKPVHGKPIKTPPAQTGKTGGATPVIEVVKPTGGMHGGGGKSK